MKLFLVLVLFLNGISLGLLSNLCENEGCSEFMKAVTNLYEIKLSETEKLISAAENQLNEVKDGNDNDLKLKLKDLDNKLSGLIKDLNTGIDGGDKTLSEIINEFFKAVKEIQIIQNETNHSFNYTMLHQNEADEKFKIIQDIIDELKDELNIVHERNTIEGPEALQNAIDKSNQFNSNSSEVKAISKEMEIYEKDFQNNLKDLKISTFKLNEKFQDISRIANSTVKVLNTIDKDLNGHVSKEVEIEEDNYQSVKKLSADALNKANQVYDTTFDLLDDVNAFELDVDLNGIKKSIDEIIEHNENSTEALIKSQKENEKFLDNLNITLKQAEEFEEMANQQKKEIEESLKTLNETYQDALMAIANKDSTLNDAKNIINGLEDFHSQVERSRERAMMAMEKSPQIVKTLKDTTALLKDAEEKVNKSFNDTMEAKLKSLEANQQLKDILKELELIIKRVKETEQKSNTLNKESSETKESLTSNIKVAENLQDQEIEDGRATEETKEKVNMNKLEHQEAEKEVEKVLKKIEYLTREINNFKDIDEASLDRFEAMLNEAEQELAATKLDGRIRILQNMKSHQNNLIQNYEIEISALEYQVFVIKGNAASLEHKCFKRTRLEP